MKVTITIDREKVMGIVEGISVIISQKNGGTPSFEQLWASEDERKKLDIYYREAVGDLERHLMRWLANSTSQFDLSATGTNYTMNLEMHRYWPISLNGLLANKVQDFMVHSITAGWLNDFQEIAVKEDYGAMAGQDIVDIRDIVLEKQFGFVESKRRDEQYKDASDADGMAVRQRDNDTIRKPSSLRTYGRGGIQSRRDDEEQVFIRHDWTDWSGTRWSEQHPRRHHPHCRPEEKPCEKESLVIEHQCGNGMCPDEEYGPLEWN